MSADSGSVEAVVRELTLRIPSDLPCQLLFRQRRTQPFGLTPPADIEYVHCAGLRGLPGFLRVVRAYRRIVSARELFKALLRIAVGRHFYCVRRGDELLHIGWVSIGWCRHYIVGGEDAVIGSIWSASAARGLGLATFATMRTINALIAQGCSTFYIDTADENVACLKMIAKCGFGAPVGIFPRKPDHA